MPGVVKVNGLEVELVFVDIKGGLDFGENELLDLDKDFFNGLDSLLGVGKYQINLCGQLLTSQLIRVRERLGGNKRWIDGTMRNSMEL
jgi:hypothetical protein